MTQCKSNIKSETKNLQDFEIAKVCQSGNLFKKLCQVVESHPDECAKNLGLSIIHLMNYEYDKMLECLNFLTQKFPDAPILHRRIAEVYIDKDDYGTAITHLEKALKLDEEDLTAKIWLSATGNEKKAKVCLKSLKEYIFVLQATDSNWVEQKA